MCFRVIYSVAWIVVCKMAYFQERRLWQQIWESTTPEHRCHWSTIPYLCIIMEHICLPPTRITGHIIRYNHTSLWVRIFDIFYSIVHYYISIQWHYNVKKWTRIILLNGVSINKLYRYTLSLQIDKKLSLKVRNLSYMFLRRKKWKILIAQTKLFKYCMKYAYRDYI